MKKIIFILLVFSSVTSIAQLQLPYSAQNLNGVVDGRFNNNGTAYTSKSQALSLIPVAERKDRRAVNINGKVYEFIGNGTNVLQNRDSSINASGGSLANGNGTTVNGSAVDLGGMVTSERRLNTTQAAGQKVLSVYNGTPRQRFYSDGSVKFGDTTNFYWDDPNKQLLINDMRIYSVSVVSGGFRSYGVIMGDSAGNFTSQYDHCVGIGGRVLRKNTTGVFNTAVGSGTLEWNTTGYNNTAFGADAMALNTLGTDNSSFGRTALEHNTIGQYNTAMGVDALLMNTSGSSNVSIGYASSNASTTGIQNTVVGAVSFQSSLTGTQNTIIGYGAANSFSSGDYNTLVGATSGQSMTGLRNSLFGGASGFSLTSGSHNTMLGLTTGQGTTTGSNNVFIGESAGGNTNVSNKLFIDVSNTNTPLIGGDFLARTVSLGGTPTNDNSQSHIMVRDASTGEIKTRDASSLVGGTSGAYLFNNGGTITAAETATGATYNGRVTYDNTTGFTTDQKNTGTNLTSFYTLSYPGGVHYRQGISPVINSYTLSPTNASQDVSDGTTLFTQGYGAGTVITVGGGGNGNVVNTYTNTGMSLVRSATNSPTAFTFTAAPGISGSTQGQDLTLTSGSGFASGTTSGGDLTLVGGAGNGAGSAGNIVMSLQTGGNFKWLGMNTNDPSITNAVYNNAGIPLISGSEIKGTATLDFPNTSAGTSSDLTITVTGALVATPSPILLGTPNGSVNANSCYTAWISADNTVTVRFNNYSTGAINPASGSFQVRLFPN